MIESNLTVVSGVSREVLDQLYKNQKVAINDLPLMPPLNPRDGLCLQSGSSSALAVVGPRVQTVELVSPNLKIESVKPRNREQFLLLHSLMDPSIPLSVGIGKAGSGKTLLALAAAIKLTLSANSIYKRIILTKPMDTVGKIQLGALPGDLHQKFSPYATSYTHQFEEILGEGRGEYIQTLFASGKIEYLPIQLMRGVSFKNTLVVADEVQSLSRHELLTIGTRMSANSKLILLGDLAQRDRVIDIRDTGLYQLCTSEAATRSPLVSITVLEKNERSPIVDVFCDALGD
mgnify:CR=1 FL=1